MAIASKPQAVQVTGTSVLQRLIASPKRTIVSVGGANSSKSYSNAQLLIQQFISWEGVKIGITRKTSPALRRTCYDLIITLLKEWNIYPLCEHDKTNMTIRYRIPAWQKESKFDFFGLDDPEKVKSADFNIIWVEEATEFSHEDYLQLQLRLRSPVPPGKINRIYLTCNPVDANSWVAKLCECGDVEVIRSTYKDNPFCSAESAAVLEHLMFEDENYYRIYALGEWGLLENLIFKKYQEVPQMPQGCKWTYGLDFGFTNPTSLCRVGQDEKAQIYLDERVYKEKLTNADLIELLSHEERADIYADSAEPQRIEEIRRAGYNIYPANKDVKFGIDLLKRQMLNITKTSPNIWKEIRGYHYKKDKDGHVIEEPVKFQDHSIDACRYGMCGLVERYGSAVTSGVVRHNMVSHTLTFRRRQLVHA